MRVVNFLALTYGKLINEPCVTIFENIIFEAHKVKRGDVFFAYDRDDIDLAILNGAYGIVFDRPTQISDIEIAWIKVSTLDDALKRVLRFKMIEKEVVAYKADEIVLKLALQIITQTDFIVLDGDIKSSFKSLWDIEDRATVLFCSTFSSSDIFTNIKQISKVKTQPIEIIEETLFETSFIYNTIFYERQFISPLFIPHLQELLHLYKSLKINFRLRKFIPIENFEAVFINSRFEIKNFGSSDRVVIFEPDISLIESEINFLKTHASWAKTIFLAPCEVEKLESREIFRYDNEKEILNILKDNSFHFALVVGADKSILNRISSYQTQLTLDF